MKRDPRHHVLPGQPLRLAAEQINALNKMMRVNGGAAGGPVAVPEQAKNIILCRNDSGSAVARWGILEISGVVFDPSSGSDAEATFTSTPCVIGVTPTDFTKPFVIAVEPIADGVIGRVAVSGVVQCKLDVANESHAFARTKAGSTSQMETADVGNSAILWKGSGAGGGKWSLLRVGGGGGGGGVRFGEISAAWNKGAVATVTHLFPDGSERDPSQTFSALNQFANIPAPEGGGTRFVMCAYVDTTWMLIAAEC